jgi:hypothetical protein
VIAAARESRRGNPDRFVVDDSLEGMTQCWWATDPVQLNKECWI